MSADFVQPESIVRTVWGDPDMLLLIFAGSAAEFALNRAADWLFVTGSLPADPLGRLFSTVNYAQRIVFASIEDAQSTLASISSIHAAVERRRGDRIPDWAHRDVLYMLIDQSHRAFELLQHPMTAAQEDELYGTFLKLGQGLHIPDLPPTFARWREDREAHLQRDLAYSEFTARLYEQYRAHLGPWRYQILLEVQALLVPEKVRELLGLRSQPVLATGSVQLYALIRRLGFQSIVQRALVPHRYWPEVENLRRYH